MALFLTKVSVLTAIVFENSDFLGLRGRQKKANH